MSERSLIRQLTLLARSGRTIPLWCRRACALSVEYMGRNDFPKPFWIGKCSKCDEAEGADHRFQDYISTGSRGFANCCPRHVPRRPFTSLEAYARSIGRICQGSRGNRQSPEADCATNLDANQIKQACNKRKLPIFNQKSSCFSNRLLSGKAVWMYQREYNWYATQPEENSCYKYGNSGD